MPPLDSPLSSFLSTRNFVSVSQPKPAVSIYVRKSTPIMKLMEKVHAAPISEEIHHQPEIDRVGDERPEHGRDKGKDIVLFNAFDLLRETDDDADGLSRGPNISNPQKFPHVEYSDMECSGTEQEGPSSCNPRSCKRIQVIDVDILNADSQFVHCRVHVHELHETILLTVVYGANEVSARRELWQGLIDLAITVGNEPWLVGGDFNAVLDLSEVSGASGDIRVAMNEFNDCILQTGLLPLPMQGERFTWHNCSLDGRSLWKRLDRLLVNDIWMERWPNLYYTCLTPRTSDHSPLVLKGDCRNMQVSLFRFDNYLALSLGFLASVHSIWRHPIVGTRMYSVTRKLKALMPVFRQQRRCKGDLAMNVKLAAGFLEVAQNILQYDRHNSLLLLMEHYCRLVYLKASKLEQIMLRQRAKLQWLKGGDQCSRIFFRRVATRRANKRVFQIFDDDGNEQTDSTVINSIFVEFFQGLLGETGLIGPLTYGRQSPGPDGFSSGFFKAAWPVVGEEVSSAIIDFFKMGRLLKQLNASLLTLIPKRKSGFTHQPSQNAFVLGRLISDNVLLAQELFSGYNQCRLPPRCTLKVDIWKAYDTVEWDFLIATLQMFGFPATFIRWIEECVTSAHYSVVVNGGCMDSSRGQEDGEFRYHWRCQDLKLFQLSFADDLLCCVASGLRDSLLATLGFQEGLLPLRYLGLPLISARLSITDCQPLLQKIDSRIKGWEGVQISFAGRVQLIKFVLISFEVYWAMAFILPKGSKR
ncbi:Transposon TX1 uncharacterized protein [Sesamum angolense]|uniref:Transposon TX1 uncharacterized protein n=1 Tax=Sesamum angolense TaxID=2727404 RepID=A0AAE1T6V1_9LAMI|nr:Transposon TX1 uncharacterized protein [Sesamum angolense]